MPPPESDWKSWQSDETAVSEIGQRTAQDSGLREKEDKQQSPSRAPGHSLKWPCQGSGVGGWGRRQIPQESGGLPALLRPQQVEMGWRASAREEGLHGERAPENGCRFPPTALRVW